MPTGDNPLSVEDQVIAPVLTASLVYDDARQAIRWLVDILGFRIATFYETPNGDVAFAELVWRTGLVATLGFNRATSDGWSSTSSVAFPVNL
jgi:uncharacterized glyoxalase superfamily protein PhnB